MVGSGGAVPSVVAVARALPLQNVVEWAADQLRRIYGGDRHASDSVFLKILCWMPETGTTPL
ncbi:MAG TPA: hypothetical protein VFV92_05910, partial [Candidatus Bathyarchaeia archaeon]|nr:hypothetical protein [Candidatus Bathyarchaeia archaeon]